MEYKGNQYVIVNVTRGPGWKPYWFYVLPGEEPHTYGTLEEAAEGLLFVMEEYGHTIETAPIFKLEPISVEEIEAVLERIQEEGKDDLVTNSSNMS